jgi:hypothetical protein
VGGDNVASCDDNPKWARRIARIREMRNAYTILRRRSCGWGKDIKIDFSEIIYKDVDRINVAERSIQWFPVTDSVMHLQLQKRRRVC